MLTREALRKRIRYGGVTVWLSVVLAVISTVARVRLRCVALNAKVGRFLRWD